MVQTLSVERLLLSILCMSCLAVSMVTKNPLRTEPVAWTSIPGRPLQGHIGKAIDFQRLIPRRQRITRGENSHSLAKNPDMLQSYIVKVKQDMRGQFVAAVKELAHDAVISIPCVPHYRQAMCDADFSSAGTR